MAAFDGTVHIALPLAAGVIAREGDAPEGSRQIGSPLRLEINAEYAIARAWKAIELPRRAAEVAHVFDFAEPRQPTYETLGTTVLEEFAKRFPRDTVDESRCVRVHMSNVHGYEHVPFAAA